MVRSFTRFLVLSLAVAASVSLPTLARADDASEKKSTEEVSYGHIEISGSYAEGAAAPGLFGELNEQLDTLQGRIEKAASDARVAGLILRISDPEFGWADVAAVRESIAAVRAKGKKVIAFMEDCSSRTYALATACDEIAMPESGTIMMVGMRAEVSFYKDLLDKLGVKMDTFRVGEYKSAAEPFSRNDMSPEFRKELEEVLDDQYNRMIDSIASARKLTKEQVLAAIDQGPLFPTKAKELGLIDSVVYEDEVESALKTAAAGKKLTFIRKYGKKKVDTDFSGLAGMVKLMELLTGMEDNGKKKSSAAKVAVIFASGSITSGKSSSDMFSGGASMGSETIVKAVREAAKDDTVKAVVLRVDSPGGSALASDVMWRELELLKKPFVVSMGNVAASGGYYISMGADKIFADPNTITGSIGVVGMRPALDGLYKKVGISTSVITRGKNAGLLGGTFPFTDEEKAAMQSTLNEIYAQFTAKAAAGRKMEQPVLEKLARGRIYTGAQAKAIGLVDELGSLRDAIAAAKQLAGLKPEDKLEQLSLPKAVNPFEQLLGGSLDARAAQHMRAAALGSLRGITPELDGGVEALGLIRLFSKERVLMMMPYQIDIR